MGESFGPLISECHSFDVTFPNPIPEAEIDTCYIATLQMLGGLISNPCLHAADAPATDQKEKEKKKQPRSLDAALLCKV